MACGEDCGSSGCCCGELTRLRGGIHPDHLIHINGIFDVNRRYQIYREPCHVNFLSAFPVVTASGKRILVRFFNALVTSETDTLEVDDQQTKIMISFTDSATSFVDAHKDTFGSYFPNGLYVEIVSNDNATAKIALTGIVIDRNNFSPAYQREDETLFQYWRCYRSDQFLENWSSGETSEPWVESDDDDDGGGGDGSASKDVWDGDLGNVDTPKKEYICIENSGGDGDTGWAWKANSYLEYQY